MTRRTLLQRAARGFVFLTFAGFAFAQQPASAQTATAQTMPPPARPVPSPLFFDENWRQPATAAAPADHGAWPASADDVSNANLTLQFYGVTRKELMLSGSHDSVTNPLNLWNGMCTSPIAVTLRDRNNYVDLTGLAKIRWVTRTSGFHTVRLLIKLADGTYLVGDRSSGEHADFDESEISISDIRWIRLDATRVVTTGTWVENPDLSKVDEIGYVDLMPGGGVHGLGAWVNVGHFVVYGKPVKR